MQQKSGGLGNAPIEFVINRRWVLQERQPGIEDYHYVHNATDNRNHLSWEPQLNVYSSHAHIGRLIIASIV